MSSQNNPERPSFESLQTDYRRAWHHFTVQVENLQAALTDVSQSEDALQAARAHVDSAVADYREARNALAQFMLEHDMHESVSVSAGLFIDTRARMQAA